MPKNLWESLFACAVLLLNKIYCSFGEFDLFYSYQCAFSQQKMLLKRGILPCRCDLPCIYSVRDIKGLRCFFSFSIIIDLINV